MDNKPKLTISGYRGIWGESLNRQIVENYTKAFVLFVRENINNNGTLLLGRDGRESGPEIKQIIIDVLNNLGINFVDGDILPTPTVLFAVKKHKYDGAIIITASHNPREYNGLKFVTNRALFTTPDEVEIIKDNYFKIENNEIQEDRIKNTEKVSTEKEAPINYPEEHADQILKHINVDAISNKKWRVAVDMINASACVLDPYLFKNLGIELVPLNDIPDGNFGHKPEPLRENLTDIGNLVRSENCDIGFAHDPDADRLVVIDERGAVISEEYTLALGTEAVLSKNLINKVVINMSTSQMNCDIAQKYVGECIRTKVGEANVVQGIQENKAIIGGEGGGGIIYPTINLARDSFVSLALILELLSERNLTLSECLDSLPHYEMRKDKVPVSGSLDEMYGKMKDHFNDCRVDELDGLRLDFEDHSWIHLRPSNTEPIVRLIGEATNIERIEELMKETREVIS